MHYSMVSYLLFDVILFFPSANNGTLSHLGELQLPFNDIASFAILVTFPSIRHPLYDIRNCNVTNGPNAKAWYTLWGSDHCAACHQFNHLGFFSFSKKFSIQVKLVKQEVVKWWGSFICTDFNQKCWYKKSCQSVEKLIFIIWLLLL